MTVRVGIVKLGNLGTSRYIDLILDERADRDIYVRSVGTGAKLGEAEADEAVKEILTFKPQVAIVISPNGALPGPTKARDAIKAAGVPVIVISDVPLMKVKDDLKAKGFGYFIVKADSMIGARRQFLDPTEMVMFNADMTKVLDGTGVVRLIQKEMDRVVGEIASGATPTLPQIVVGADKAVPEAGYKNPYAKAKAFAAYAMAEKVGDLDLLGCFMQKEMDQYVITVASAHELLRAAARLVDEAREIEKDGDSLLRTPHAADGKVLSKTSLPAKPE
jgi:Coenzyme F420-dependent N(5),N(10)-methenyltetrahydromethanopterin dehydrogenase